MSKDEYRSTRTWPYHISCGGVVYRQGEAGAEFALLVRRGGRRGAVEDSWHLPKGTLHRSETLEQAALREIQEESGLETVVEAYLGALQGRFVHPGKGQVVDKTTHYFLCRWTGATVAMDDEHDAVEWLPLEVALARLAIGPKSEGVILERAFEWLSHP